MDRERIVREIVSLVRYNDGTEIFAEPVYVRTADDSEYYTPGHQVTSGGLTEWDSETKYAADEVVLDRDGMWKATGTNTDSRPIPGNTDWELVGGAPYVDVVLDPVHLTTLPFYHAESPLVSPGFPTGLGAPGDDLIVLPLRVDAFPSNGDAWGQEALPSLFWGDLAIGASFFIVSMDNLDQNQGPGYAVYNTIPLANQGATHVSNREIFPTYTASSAIDQALSLVTSTDITNGGATVGTASIRYRIYYCIVPVTDFQNLFFHITAVDDEAKTFTVNGDAHALTGSITIVGSTANDGAYTIVSATFDTDHTDIVVAGAIPDATADGWVKQ